MKTQSSCTYIITMYNEYLPAVVMQVLLIDDVR